MMNDFFFFSAPIVRRALPLEPDPDLDPYLTRFINVLHAHNEGRRFAGPEDLREALFPAWKSMVRPCSFRSSLSFESRITLFLDLYPLFI